MLKLRRLRVERFRSLARGTELSFSDGINVVLGQNGTGKTTLLELISMVMRSDFSSVAKEEFEVEYELAASQGERTVVIVRNRRLAAEQAQTSVELGPREDFQPTVEVLEGNDRRELLRYEGKHLLRGGVSTEIPFNVPLPLSAGFLLTFVLFGLEAARGRTLMQYLLQLSQAYRLDESLDLFRRITASEELPGYIFAGSNGWQPNSFASPFVPYSIIEQLKKAYQPTKPDYALKHDNLDFLSAIHELMGFSASELRVDVTERRDPPTMQLGNLVFRFWWEDRSFITHEHLSYGQKRLLTFFYYLACNPQIVIADELVNGLHHRWITASLNAIGARQAFLTSQNPLLLDYVPITSAAEVQRSFVLCTGVARDGRPGWLWENMSEDDARELYAAYEVGIEHVSEILQSRGLW
jgi:energy-coupling factor transporter ATP-binding protein EcfA2